MLNITALSYLVCSVLFILALKGLSSPTTSRQGNTYGMIGMALAVVTTFLIPSFKPVYWLIGVAIVAGAIIGSITANDQNARARRFDALFRWSISGIDCYSSCV